MARGRMIAKTVSTSQRYARLNHVAGKLAEFCQAIYPLLVAHADDFGRLAGDVFTVKHAICPTSPRKESDVEAALAALHTVNLVIWYEVEGRKCLQIVDFDKYQTGLHKRTKSEFAEPSGNFRELPSEGKGREQKRTEEKGREGNGAEAPSTLASVSPISDPQAPNCKIEAFVQLWNETVTAPIAACRGISDQRRDKIRLRLKERPMGEWLAIFQRIEASAFCHGQNDRRWVMSLDWIVKNDEHALRVLEGKYDDRAGLKATGTEGRGRTGAPDPQKYANLEEQG